jgi:hypothetical protein
MVEQWAEGLISTSFSQHDGIGIHSMIKMYGPYRNADTGYWNVVFKDLKTKKMTSQSYARYLMEQQLGEKIPYTHDVDHIDKNPNNNRLDNLQVILVKINRATARKTVERIEVPCAGCSKILLRTQAELNRNLKHFSGRMYCSKSCNGKINN